MLANFVSDADRTIWLLDHGNCLLGRGSKAIQIGGTVGRARACHVLASHVAYLDVLLLARSRLHSQQARLIRGEVFHLENRSYLLQFNLVHMTSVVRICVVFGAMKLCRVLRGTLVLPLSVVVLLMLLLVARSLLLRAGLSAEQFITQLLGLVERATQRVVYCDLLLSVLAYHLNYKVWVRLKRKFLVAHVNVWVAAFELFEFLACEEAVVFALVMDFVDVFLAEGLLGN